MTKALLALLLVCAPLARADDSDAQARRQVLDKAAKEGSGEAMLKIGIMYSEGDGVSQDHEEALRWFRKAGDKEHAPALSYIGQAYDLGQGVVQDHAEAFKWYRKAAATGDAVGQHNLSVAYREGSGTARNDAQAVKWALKAAEQKLPRAMQHMGWFYHEGRGVERDYAKAAEWFRKGADAGDAYSRAQLGQMHLNGKGVDLDYKEALKWLRLAAAQKEPEAMNTIGWCYERGYGVTVSLAKAASWYEEAVGLGNATAQHNLGVMRFSGEGVPKDLASACDLFRKAAAQGNADAQAMLPHCGDAAAPATADRGPVLAAAKKGDAEAQAMLAYMLREGQGGEKDLPGAFKWSRKAAEQGHANAMADVGWAYSGGHGTRRSMSEAVKWFKRSVDAGSAAGQYNLAAMYDNGDGVAADKARACALYRKAEQGGHPDAPAAVALCAAAAPAEPAALAAAPKSPLETPSFHLAPRPRDFAVVVGIERYKRAPRADFAERDAAAAEAHFLAMGLPQRNVIRIAGDDATRSRLAAYLEEWLPKNVTADSTVYFYYSGHGAPDAATGQAYLLPVDGDPSFLKTTAYPLKDLYAALGKLKAKEVVVALDSCFSGAGGRSVIAKGARPLVAVASPSAGTGRVVVFAAAQGEQITGGFPEKEHGLFTYHFLTGLAGAAKDRSGRVTAQGLFDYLKPLVEDEARRQNREQSPTLTGPDGQVLVKF